MRSRSSSPSFVSKRSSRSRIGWARCSIVRCRASRSALAPSWKRVRFSCASLRKDSLLARSASADSALKASASLARASSRSVSFSCRGDARRRAVRPAGLLPLRRLRAGCALRRARRRGPRGGPPAPRLWHGAPGRGRGARARRTGRRPRGRRALTRPPSRRGRHHIRADGPVRAPPAHARRLERPGRPDESGRSFGRHRAR